MSRRVPQPLPTISIGGEDSHVISRNQDGRNPSQTTIKLPRPPCSKKIVNLLMKCAG